MALFRGVEGGDDDKLLPAVEAVKLLAVKAVVAVVDENFLDSKSLSLRFLTSALLELPWDELPLLEQRLSAGDRGRSPTFDEGRLAIPAVAAAEDELATDI